MELTNDRLLFALLKTVSDAGHDNLATMSMRTLDPAFNYDRVGTAKRLRSRSNIRLSGQVPASDYPILVTFDELNDPLSVRLVDPEDLGAIFGDGVQLAAIRVELTDDTVTEGLRQRLPWLQEDSVLNLDSDFRPTVHPTLPQQLRHADFQRRTFE